jgi:hypothetical protein
MSLLEFESVVVNAYTKSAEGEGQANDAAAQDPRGPEAPVSDLPEPQAVA